METKTWKADVDGSAHEVKLLWTYWGGRREVQVDGQTVEESTVPMRWKSRQAFDLSGHEAVVETKPSRAVSPYFTISLTVDGREVTPEPGSSKWERTRG